MKNIFILKILYQHDWEESYLKGIVCCRHITDKLSMTCTRIVISYKKLNIKIDHYHYCNKAMQIFLPLHYVWYNSDSICNILQQSICTIMIQYVVLRWLDEFPFYDFWGIYNLTFITGQWQGKLFRFCRFY